MTRPIITLPDPSWLDDVQVPDSVEARVWDVAQPVTTALGDDASRVQFVFLPYLKPTPALGDLHQLPELAVVQSPSAGYDHLLGRLPEAATFCNAAGVHDASTAELTVGLTLASLRGIGFGRRPGEWDDSTRLSLADRRVMVLGAGAVGAAIAARLRPFEVHLTRVATRARQDDHGDIHGIAELPQLLADQDVVIVIVPLTDTTRGLVDDAFLAAMPDGALLVNVARGPVADTDALLRHARRLNLALDVTDPEPLPADHPLWAEPNVLITPHVGGNTTAFRPRAARLVSDQLRRFTAGEELVNVVRQAR